MTSETSVARETRGVLLMTYGSPATLDDVPAYLASVRGGQPAPEELVREFQRRYRVIGGSPLLQITQQQAAAVEMVLNATATPGVRYVAGVGMRHAPPFIGEGLAGLVTAGARRIATIILSPQYSPALMGGYHRAVEAALERLPRDIQIHAVGAWHFHPDFLGALADRVREAIDRLPAPVRQTAPILLTAHSLPKAVIDREPGYLQQLQQTVRAVVDLVGLDSGRWLFAYQSAGHTPAEWLKPDLKDLLPQLRQAGHTHVLVVPVQFVADHLETLYDLDVAARAEAEHAGLVFSRIEALNCAPRFIAALADIARRAFERRRTSGGV